MRIKTILFLLIIFCLTKLNAVEIYGHRGAAGLASENTLTGIATALSIGVDAIDMDIVLTKDGQIVLNHDPFLNPDFTQSNNGDWILSPVSLTKINSYDLKHYRVGKVKPNSTYRKQFPMQKDSLEEIPTLKEALLFLKSKAPKTLKIQIEIKTHANPSFGSAHPEQFIPQLIKTLTEANLTNPIEIHSFDWRNLILLQQQAPNLVTSYLTDKEDKDIQVFATQMHVGFPTEVHQHQYPALIYKLGGKIWCPNFQDLTEHDLKIAKAFGLKVNVWTVDNPKDMQRMIDLNVDGIITNRPDILRSVMKARALNLPPIYNFT